MIPEALFAQKIFRIVIISDFDDKYFRSFECKKLKETNFFFCSNIAVNYTTYITNVEDKFNAENKK